MIIGVDAGMLGIHEPRLRVGVYRIALHLLTELSKLDRANTYLLFSFEKIQERFGPKMKNIVLRPAAGFMQVRLPIELKKWNVELFLGLGQAIPPFFKGRSIGFIYDLGFLYNPNTYGSSEKKLVSQTMSLVKRASRIVTISQATKKDIIKNYPWSPPITVAYPGVNSIFKKHGPRYKQKNPYILSVGSLTKTKDVPLLIQALSFTKKPFDLLLVGGDYWPDSEIEATIHTLKLTARVKKLGFVSDSELSKYYRGAVAFASTSLREGFCLPLAEALRSGTPAVVVNRGALPEIVGEAGIIVDQNPKHIAQAFDAIDKIKFQKKTISQAKKYTWEAFAKKIHSLYEA